MRNFYAIILLSFLIQTLVGQKRYDDAPQRFLLPEPPPEIPRLMASGLISSGLDESGGTFTDDNLEFFYTVNHRADLSVIVQIKYRDSFWSYPETATFSGVYQDADPFIKNDKLYFSSTRPINDKSGSGIWNIWVMERKDKTWTNPQPIVLNPNKNERHPTVADNGNLYFYADYESEGVTFDFLNTDIYVSVLEDGMYQSPIKLNETINSTYADYTPLIAPDESFMIFASNRSGGQGNSDLYISIKIGNNKWSEAINAGAVINSTENDHYPSLSPDGLFLMFTSDRRLLLTGHRNITYSDLKRIILGPGNGFGDLYYIGKKALNLPAEKDTP